MRRLLLTAGMLWMGIAQFAWGQTARLDTAFHSFKFQKEFPYFNPTQIYCMPNGSIRVIGKVNASYENNALQIVGLHPDGGLDSSFGNAGIVRFSGYFFELERWPIEATPDGGFLIMERTPSQLYDDSIRVHKFLANGQPDSTFGQAGILNIIPTRYLGDLCVYPDGRFAVGGSNPYPNTGFGKIARYMSDGSPDWTFNGSGIQEFELLEGRMALQADGKIVITNRYGKLLRFNETGGLDEQFGDNGYSTRGKTEADVIVGDMIVTELGKILGVNNGFVSAVNDQGIVDVGFGQNGVATGVNGVSWSPFDKVREMDDHRIVFQAESVRPDNPEETSYSVEMLKPNGQRDTSWFGGALVLTDQATILDFDIQGNAVLVLWVDGMGMPGNPLIQRYISGEPSSHSVQSDWSIFPNPSDYGFHIVLELEARQFVDLALFDVQGRRVDNIASGGMMDAGSHALEYQYPWDLAPGVYFAVLTVDNEQRVKKVLRIGNR